MYFTTREMALNYVIMWQHLKSLKIMEYYGIAGKLYTNDEAKPDLYSWMEQRWDEDAVRYMKRYL